MTSPLERILQAESAYSHYQPILSIKRRKVVGYEALGRAQDPDTGIVVAPLDLFEMADTVQRRKLDHLFKRNAVEGYGGLGEEGDHPLLFLNCDVKSLDEAGLSPEVLQAWLFSNGLTPSNVVLEIVESEAPNIELLTAFVEIHRRVGFLVALDDVGIGYSNLDRVPLLRPDIIKIDRCLVAYLEKNNHQQEVFKALVQLSRHIGALVVAEGVERREEVMACIGLGADMLQGFYFAHPHRPGLNEEAHLQELLESVTAEYRVNRLSLEKIRRARRTTYYHLAGILAGRLVQTRPGGFKETLEKFIHKNPFTEALYILDETGLQMTEVVTNPALAPARPSPLFQPPPIGTDHSMKDYFYIPQATEQHGYLSDPYVSLATGRRCVTLVYPFDAAQGGSCLLCMDLRDDS